PLVLFHAGLPWHWGGSLPVVFTLVYLGVFGSGVWGLVLQQSQPRELLEDVPAETVYSQIPTLLEQSRREARLLVLATCGFPEDERGRAMQTLGGAPAVTRRAQKNQGTGLLRALPPAPLEGCEVLRRYFDEQVEPFLAGQGRSRLRLRETIVNDFRDLRSRLPEGAHPAARALEDLCERRRQLERQARLHGWLHGWVSVHLCLTAALLVLLV